MVLPLLESDLLTVMQACVNGTLSDTEVRFSKGSAACVIIASGGYPESYQKGFVLHGLDENGGAEGVTVYHAGTALKDGALVNAGGRVLGVTGTGDTLQAALDKAYAAVDTIGFEGSFFRRDIGAKALAAK